MSYSPVYDRYENQKAAFFRKDMVTVQRLAGDARAELVKKGYVSAWPVFRWIEKEWFDKANAEGILNYHSERYGYQIVAYEREVEEVVERRGRTPIITKKMVKLDCSRFEDFCKSYQEYRQKKERQEFTIDRDIKRLIETSDA